MMQNQHHHQQHQQLTPPPHTAGLTLSPPPPSTTDTTTEAPPKQVAMAMDRLGQAARVIADIRLGADRLLEALFVSAESHQSSKILNLILKEDSSMQQHLHDLRNIGRQLESSGVLTEALRSRSNSWGLHIPLVCPDGAVVAYAWKRQLAGQAGASAVDRTRLALKSFMDQKRRFFPHLDSESPSKKQRISQQSLSEELSDYKTLADIQTHIEKEIPNMKVTTYERLQWLKRASLLPAPTNEGSYDTSIEHDHVGNNLRDVLMDDTPLNKVGVIELLVPSVFRAVVSLHPVGSTHPDAVSFFSPDEGGRHVHARGLSIYHVYRHITELSNTALQYFHKHKPEMSLYYLLLWVSGYQNLFTQACSKCERLLSMDKQSALFLPPVLRPYREFFTAKTVSTSPKNTSSNTTLAYHVSCAPHDV